MEQGFQTGRHQAQSLKTAVVHDYPCTRKGNLPNGP
jgi:hypothetical protein